MYLWGLTLCSCLLFWVPAAEGGFHPSVCQCSTKVNSACAEVLPAAKRPYSALALPARRPVRRSLPRVRFITYISNIDFNPLLQNERPPTLSEQKRYPLFRAGGVIFLPEALILKWFQAVQYRVILCLIPNTSRAKLKCVIK